MTIPLPSGIECTKWEPASPGAKLCRYYIPPGEMEAEGLCKLPSELLCVEWVRRNGSEAQKSQLLDVRRKPKSAPPIPDGDTPAPLVLAAQDPLPPRPPPARPPARLRTASGDVLLAPPTPFEPAKEIDPSSLEALERAGVEVELSAPHLDGGVTIVPVRTGRTDRSEITWREVATVRLVVDAFPGAHVVAYRAGVVGVTPESSLVPRNGRPLIDLLDRPFDDCPLAGTHCSVCGSPQRRTSGGLSCIHGHGGAEPMLGEALRSTPAEEAGVSEAAYAAEMAIGTGGPDDPTLEEDPLS
jgi:hypothetical protein